MGTTPVLVPGALQPRIMGSIGMTIGIEQQWDSGGRTGDGPLQPQPVNPVVLMHLQVDGLMAPEPPSPCALLFLIRLGSPPLA